MKLILPKNVFSSIYVRGSEADKKFAIHYSESSLIIKELSKDTSAIALIPTLELINHRNLFVSSKFGISFDGALSNSYFYFNKEGKNFKKIFLRNDIAINEVLLAKIIFSEMYSTEIEIVLDTAKTIDSDKDYLVAGDDNFNKWDYVSAMSIAEEVTDFIELPYVNFVMVSQDKDSLEVFNNTVDQIDSKIEDSITDLMRRMEIPEEAKSFITENLNSLYYTITENEINAIGELLKLTYYRGIINEIIDIKLV